MADYIPIPPHQLSEEALQAVIEEYITREGTDYGLQEYSLAQKVNQVKRQLDDGRAELAYDPVTESCTLIVKE